MGGPKDAKKQSPKAKRKTKSSKSKEQEEAKKKPTEEEEEENELEFQKVLLEIRVKELETLNAGLKQKSDYLETQNDVYKTQLQETKQERDELVSYLQRCLTEEKTISKELEARLIGVVHARSNEVKMFEKKLKEKDEKFEEMKATLDKNVLELEMQLLSIEDFRVQKLKLTKEMEDLQAQLESERAQFKEEFNSLERKMIEYREKIKNDAISTLTDISKDVQQAGKLCLTGTIKTAIAANSKLNQELEIASKDNLRLRERITTLSTKCGNLHEKLVNFNTEKKGWDKKNLQYKNIIQILSNKQVELDEKIKKTHKIEKKLSKIENEHKKCRSDSEIEEFIFGKIENVLSQTVKTVTSELEMKFKLQMKKLQDVILAIAVSSRDLTQVNNPEEFAFCLGRFKSTLIKAHQIACELPDLSPEIKSRLKMDAPTILPYIEFPGLKK